jgi:hypothetical protein
MNMNKNDVALSDTRREHNQSHNVYNNFFMLERQLLVQETERLSGIAAADKNQYDLGGYDLLSLSDLPPRFRNLHLPQGRYVPGKSCKRKRKHAKAHGGELLLFVLA